MGAAKRRRQAGAYPRGGVDPGYAQMSARLRQLFPRISERDVGLAWMRAEDPNPEIKFGAPETFPRMPGCVVIHLLMGDGASLNGALRIGEIDTAIAAWRATGLNLLDTRQVIFESIALHNHREEKYGHALLTWAIALAFTSDVAGALREHAARGSLRITYEITDFLDRRAGNKPAINFRLVGSDQHDPPVTLSFAEVPPPAIPTPDPDAQGH